MIVNDRQDEIQGFLRDASNMPGGSADRVCFVENEQEIAGLLRECSESRTPVTVSGAGTGLAGGRTPIGGVVLSLAKMNRVLAIDDAKRRAVVEPGVILGEFQREVEQHGMIYPPDPTERNCFIGGTVATNASGARTFKYGPTRAYIEALRVVLSTGETLSIRRGQVTATGHNIEFTTTSGRTVHVGIPTYVMPAIKHAAGYFARPGMDGADLFIGSEGTLGVVSQVEVRLLPAPERLFSGVVFFAEEQDALRFVDEVREFSRRRSTSDRSGSVLDARALEFIDANSLDLIRDRYPTIPTTATGGAIWFEQEVVDDNEEQALEQWYELIQRHSGLVDESWFAISEEDQRRMREFRHAVPSAVYEYISSHGQTKLGTDMAVPSDRFHELFAYYRKEFADNGLYVVTYGHIGDCHLHANILSNPGAEYLAARTVFSRLVHKAIELGGTISAEHGVGKIKRDYLKLMYGERGIAEMLAVKRALDPALILGTGTMFDVTETL